MKHHILLIVHLLAATVWVGGHLILSLVYLPKAIRERNANVIRQFEAHYEKLGIPALLLLVITGVSMGYDYGVTVSDWFCFSTPIERVVSVKLGLLGITILLAVHARLFLVPKLSDENLKQMAWHIVPVTVIGLLMLVLGTFVRFGGL